MKNRSKTLLVKGIISSSLLVSMGGVFAHTIQGRSLHEHVPLSLTSTIILGILLIFTGLFILPRMQGRHIRTLATTTLLAGVITAGVGGKLISDAVAADPDPECEISNQQVLSADCFNIPDTKDMFIYNKSDNEVVVTFDDTHPDAVQLQNRGLNIELVKGPIKQSVVGEFGNCDFPQTLAPETGCHFNHSAEPHDDDERPR